MQASIGQAGPVYKTRADNPYWKSDPNFQGMLQNVLRGVWPGYPGPITPAAVEVQAQYILCDMAGRVVVGGLSPEAALKEAHKRVEDIHRIRSRGLREATTVAVPAARAAQQGCSSAAAGAVGLRRVLGPDYRMGFLFVRPSRSASWRWSPIRSATRSTCP